MRGKDDDLQTPVPGVFPGGCLVLSPDIGSAPKALLNALASRGLAPSVVHDPPAVMTALASRPHGRRVLVVVEPGRWPRLAELIDAVGVYHGDVLCWQYTVPQGEVGRLSVLSVEGLAGGEGSNGEGPVGQILGRRRPVDDLLVKVGSVEDSARDIITRQELTMLLGPAPGEAS